MQKRKRDAETEEEMPHKRIPQRLAPRPLVRNGFHVDHGETDSMLSVEPKLKGVRRIKALIQLMNMMITGLGEDVDPDEAEVVMDMLKAWKRDLADKGLLAVPPTDA